MAFNNQVIFNNNNNQMKNIILRDLKPGHIISVSVGNSTHLGVVVFCQ